MPTKNPETAKNPKEVDEHNFGPKPTGTQTRNQTKPTDTDRPNPVQDPGREPTPNCTTKFSRVHRLYT